VLSGSAEQLSYDQFAAGSDVVFLPLSKKVLFLLLAVLSNLMRSSSTRCIYFNFMYLIWSSY